MSPEGNKDSGQSEETAELDILKLTQDDISNLLEELSRGLPAPPSAMPVESISLNLASAQQLTPYLQPELLDLEAPSPEMCFLQTIPLEASGGDSLLSTSVQSPTLDTNDLQQPATPMPSFMQAANQGHHFVAVCHPQPSTHGSKVLPAVPLASVGNEPSSYSVQHQEEGGPVPSSSDAADAPKKRGLKGASKRSSRPRKPKLYEMGPLEDKEAEERRKKAINAKKHRDKDKEEKANLAKKVKTLTAENNKLRQQLANYGAISF